MCEHNHIRPRHPHYNHHDCCFARHTLATAAILAGRALGCGVARFPLLFILFSSSSPCICIGSPQPHPPYPHTSPSSYSPPNLQAHLNDRIGWARTMQQEALPSHSSDSSFDRLEIFESKATLLLPFNNSDTIVIITYLTLPLTAALAAGAAGHRWLLQR